MVINQRYTVLHGNSVRSGYDGSSDRSFMVDPLSYFSFQPVLFCLWDDAYKRTLVAKGKRSPCGGSGFPLSLAEWSFTIIMSDAI